MSSGYPLLPLQGGRLPQTPAKNVIQTSVCVPLRRHLRYQDVHLQDVNRLHCTIKATQRSRCPTTQAVLALDGESTSTNVSAKSPSKYLYTISNAQIFHDAGIFVSSCPAGQKSVCSIAFPLEYTVWWLSTNESARK